MISGSISSFIHADSGVLRRDLCGGVGCHLALRLLARELASPMPRVVVHHSISLIAVLFVLFVLIVVERFHVLG